MKAPVGETDQGGEWWARRAWAQALEDEREAARRKASSIIYMQYSHVSAVNYPSPSP